MSGDALFQTFESSPPTLSSSERLTMYAVAWLTPRDSRYLRLDTVDRLRRYSGLGRTAQYRSLSTLIRGGLIEDERLTLGRRLRLNVGSWHLSGDPDDPRLDTVRETALGVPEGGITPIYLRAIEKVPDNGRVPDNGQLSLELDDLPDGLRELAARVLETAHD